MFYAKFLILSTEIIRICQQKLRAFHTGFVFITFASRLVPTAAAQLNLQAARGEVEAHLCTPRRIRSVRKLTNGPLL